jgi:hypothetical protein
MIYMSTPWRSSNLGKYKSIKLCKSILNQTHYKLPLLAKERKVAPKKATMKQCKRIICLGWGLVAHNYNPSYSGSRDQGDQGLKPALGKQFARPYVEKTYQTQTQTQTQTQCL